MKPADRSLQILLLCYEYPPIGGGGGVGAQRYAEAWASAGHRVTVLTGGSKGLPRTQRLLGVDIIRVPTILKTSRSTTTIPGVAVLRT